jgi:hypothetical protein
LAASCLESCARTEGGRSVFAAIPGSSPGQALQGATSAFTRVFDALWRGHLPATIFAARLWPSARGFATQAP